MSVWSTVFRFFVALHPCFWCDRSTHSLICCYQRSCCIPSFELPTIGSRAFPVSDVLARQHLRSATRHFVVVPRCRLSTIGPPAFSVAGPSLWNSTRQFERSGSWLGQLQASAGDAFIYTVLKLLTH